MAKDKKAILIYSNWEQTFENLSDEEAGRLIKHFFRYVNDKNPQAPDRITELVFEPIKAVLKSDLEKYEKVKNDKSIQGRLGNLKRWNNDLFLQVENETIILEQAELIAKQRKLSVSDEIIANATKTSLNIAVNDNVNDNDNDNDNVNNIKDISALPTFSFYNSLLNYGFKKELVSDWLKVRKTKKATNTETAFNNFIKEIEKRNFDINNLLEFIVVKNWSSFKWTWYDTEIEKEKSSAKKESEPIVAGRQTLSTIQSNSDWSMIDNPYLKK